MALFTNKITRWVFVRDLAGLLLFYLFGAIFMPRQLFLAVLNGMLGVISISVIVMYFADIMGRVRRDQINAPTVLRIGLVLAWIITGMQAFSRVYFIEFLPGVGGRTFDSLVGSPAVGFIVAAALHLIAIGMTENRFVRRNMCVVVWSVMIGAALVLAIHGVNAVTG